MRFGAEPGFLFDARARQGFFSTGTMASDEAVSRGETKCHCQELSQLPALCKWIRHIPQWPLGAVHPKLNVKAPSSLGIGGQS